ncbi:putative phosphomannomutase [Rosa chinensis]|uniref:Putative phosphomannomutase n=1 Tax=Rosa chinensis TaxID=74649 RepID=A0A2P6QFR8_ROSCH|nr:putative phosphomannomutase [Rosa chinensis]
MVIALLPIPKDLCKTYISMFMGDYDYVFSENGLMAHKDVKLIGT